MNADRNEASSQLTKAGAAIGYAERGWHVVPIHSVASELCSCRRGTECDRPGKHPITSQGLKDATADFTIVSRWWIDTPDANVGILTGPESGFWVLDVDGPEGVKAIAELERQHGALPRTPTTRTGGGGRHFFFAWPAGRVIKNAAGLAGQPIDVRANAGYVVAPPSTHASGASYEWEVSPNDAALAEAPPWLIELVTKKIAMTLPTTIAASVHAGRHVFRMQSDLDLTTASGVEEGSRHQRALELVGAHLGRGQDAAEVEALALGFAARCTPPMDEAEVMRIVTDLAKQQRENNHTAVGDWEPPVTLTESSLPPFPTSQLPTWLKDFVLAEAEATQTPPDLTAMLALATIAAAGARRVEVRVKPDYAEPINIYTVVALPSANRKSAVFAHVVAPLVDMEWSEGLRMAPEIRAAKAHYDTTEARLEKLQKELVRAKPEEQIEKRDQIDALARELATMTVPTPPRLLADDVTPEKLPELLQQNDGRMALMSAEGGLFDIMAGRYGQKGKPNFDVFLKAHAGDPLWVDRVTRGSNHVVRPALTLGLAVQPDVICGLAGAPGFRGRGLLARFNYSLPASFVGRRNPNPPPVPPEVSAAYQRNIKALASLPSQPPGERGEAVPYYLHLSPEASQRFHGFAAWLEPQLAPSGELGAIADWAGKLAGGVVRIAGTLHLAEHADHASSWSVPITLATLEQAIVIGEYLIAHAQAAFRMMGMDEHIEDAQHVLNWIQRRALTSFSERELFEGVKGYFKTMHHLRPALEVLIQHGYLRVRLVERKPGPGRPPSPLYDVTRSSFRNHPSLTAAVRVLILLRFHRAPTAHAQPPVTPTAVTTSYRT